MICASLHIVVTFLYGFDNNIIHFAMKRKIPHLVCIALLVFSAMVVASCSDSDDEVQYHETNVFDNVITPEGGVLVALDGNVTLTFPEGAINDDVKFDVNTCFDDVENNYLLRPIRIDPIIQFNRTVLVELRYDNILAANSDDMSENISLIAEFFRSEMDFYFHSSCGCCDCTIDFEAKKVSFYICSSGIITIQKK